MFGFSIINILFHIWLFGFAYALGLGTPDNNWTVSDFFKKVGLSALWFVVLPFIYVIGMLNVG